MREQTRIFLKGRDDMRWIIGGLLLAGAVLSFVSLAAAHWPLYTSLVIGGFIVPCFIGKFIRWGLDDEGDTACR